MRLLIATHNQGKKREFQALFAGLELELLNLDDAGIVEVIPEDGTTFAENALAKARGYATLSGLLTLADDSGLEVDALGGAPGVFSARYGGPGLSDADRYRLLLENLQSVPAERRTARFRCVIALAHPDGRAETVDGVCEGRIADEPRGQNGFGYDPVFLLPERGCTMAELPDQVKNGISHRARAANRIRERLARLYEAS